MESTNPAVFPIISNFVVHSGQQLYNSTTLVITKEAISLSEMKEIVKNTRADPDGN